MRGHDGRVHLDPLDMVHAHLWCDRGPAVPRVPETVQHDDRRAVRRLGPILDCDGSESVSVSVCLRVEESRSLRVEESASVGEAFKSNSIRTY